MCLVQNLQPIILLSVLINYFNLPHETNMEQTQTRIPIDHAADQEGRHTIIGSWGVVVVRNSIIEFLTTTTSQLPHVGGFELDTLC